MNAATSALIVESCKEEGSERFKLLQNIVLDASLISMQNKIFLILPEEEINKKLLTEDFKRTNEGFVLIADILNSKDFNQEKLGKFYCKGLSINLFEEFCHSAFFENKIVTIEAIRVVFMNIRKFKTFMEFFKLTISRKNPLIRSGGSETSNNSEEIFKKSFKDEIVLYLDKIFAQFKLIKDSTFHMLKNDKSATYGDELNESFLKMEKYKLEILGILEFLYNSSSELLLRQVHGKNNLLIFINGMEIKSLKLCFRLKINKIKQNIEFLEKTFKFVFENTLVKILCSNDSFISKASVVINGNIHIKRIVNFACVSYSYIFDMCKSRFYIRISNFNACYQGVESVETKYDNNSTGYDQNYNKNMVHNTIDYQLKIRTLNNFLTNMSEQIKILIRTYIDSINEQNYSEFEKQMYSKIISDVERKFEFIFNLLNNKVLKLLNESYKCSQENKIKNREFRS